MQETSRLGDPNRPFWHCSLRNMRKIKKILLIPVTVFAELFTQWHKTSLIRLLHWIYFCSTCSLLDEGFHVYLNSKSFSSFQWEAQKRPNTTATPTNSIVKSLTGAGRARDVGCLIAIRVTVRGWKLPHRQRAATFSWQYPKNRRQHLDPTDALGSFAVYWGELLTIKYWITTLTATRKVLQIWNYILLRSKLKDIYRDEKI